MANKTNKEAKDNPKQMAKPEFEYINEDVKNYAYSDYVRLNSFPRGMLLSFGKMRPEDGKFIVFQEILLPFEVAVSLSTIIKVQIDELISKGALKEVPMTKEGDK